MTAAWLALVAAATSSLFTYLISRRRYAGRVNSTEANALWKEQTHFRERLHERIDELERDLGEEQTLRQFEALKCRTTQHELRNEIMTLQFLTHPEIPEETKALMLQRQGEHVSQLMKEVEEMNRRLRDKGLQL